MESSDATPESHTEHARASLDWLMLGFLILALTLSSIVTLFILIAYQNGPAA